MSNLLKRLMELSDLPYKAKEVAPIEEATELTEEERLLAETAAAELIAQSKARNANPTANKNDTVEPPTPDALDLEGDEQHNGIASTESGKKMPAPAEVMSQVKQRISELKAAIEKYDERGYNEGGVKVNAVDCLEKIAAFLSLGTEEGYAEAQVFLGTLMSPITGMFPPRLIKYLATQK